MILDEATSNVDAHTEQAIQNAMAVLLIQKGTARAVPFKDPELILRFFSFTVYAPAYSFSLSFLCQCQK